MEQNQGLRQIRMTPALQQELANQLAQTKMVGVEPEIKTGGPRGKERLDLIVFAVGKYSCLAKAHLLDLFYYNLASSSAERQYKLDTHKLIEQGWLVRERSSWHDYVYRLGQWGEVLMAQYGRNLFGDRGVLMGHDLLIADVMTRVLREARQADYGGEWIGEYEARLNKELIPDAIGTIMIGRSKWDFCLEADTGSEWGNQFTDKYYTYLRYVRDSEAVWQSRFRRKQFPAVLVVTSGREGRLGGMVSGIEERMEG